jgi:uncharacterized protein (TIGR02996 family)
MTDGEALRRAIVADPDDDTPRLIYADWLDENGRPDRAAFVRAQIEAARAEPFGPAARAAQERADRLLERHRDEWVARVYGRVIGCEFVRGFVGHVTVDAGAFPEHAGFLFETQPIQGVRVVRRLVAGHFNTSGAWVEGGDSLRPVFEQPELWQINRLDLSELSLSEDEYDALEGSRSLVGVRDLSFREAPVDPKRLTSLLAGDSLPHLCGLNVSECTHLEQAVTAGLRRASHRRFARLDLSGVTFQRSEHLKQLLGCACLSELEELRLARPAVPVSPGPLSFLNIGWVLPWGRLRVLDVTGQQLGWDGVREIARQSEASRLRWLGLGHNGIGLSGVDELINAPHLNLYYLDVRGNGLDRDTFAALRNRFSDAVIPDEGGLRGWAPTVLGSI